MFEHYQMADKERLFNEIAKHYFDRNFGTMSKTDLETMLFQMMVEYIRKYEPEKYSDYQISKALGISQAKVRNLKIRAELLYPRENFEEEWKDIFLDYIKNADYDPRSGLVKMNIPDVNVLTELRYYLESNGWYDEYQLNPRLFTCPLNVFLRMCQKLDGDNLKIDENTKKKLDKLKELKLNEDEQSALEYLRDGNTKEALRKFGKKLSSEFINEVLGTGIFGKGAKILLNAIKEK